MLDMLIIGAGQAGLALGYYLRRTPLRFQLVERNKRIGDSWRRRYDALELFTPRAYSALPGLALTGDPDGYADKDEVAAYLEAYARHFDLPVLLGTGIQSHGLPAWSHFLPVKSPYLGYAGAPLRRLDLEGLPVALCNLLREEWEDGYLIYQIVV